MALISSARSTGSFLSDRIDFLRQKANLQLVEDRRKELGQYMTPSPITRLMASMLECESSEIKLLDAGAGVGSLSAAAVESLCQRLRPPEHIQITAYEIEPILIPYLENTLQLCKETCDQAGIEFSGQIIEADFIADAVEQLSSPLFIRKQQAYTAAILNPPYRKIQTESTHRRLLQRVNIETSNLYTGFLALAIKLLAPEGELVAITPRSFCNGSYFRPFRELLLQEMALRQFHLFESRQQAFRDDAVLQENIIISARKSNQHPSTITITSGAGPDDDMPGVRDLPYDQVIHPHDRQQFFHLVSDDIGGQIAHQIKNLPATLADLPLEVSTGRVVDFRAESYLREQPETGTMALIYPTHLNNGRVTWPKVPSKKPNALVYCTNTASLFVPNATYVLVKRFSAKEERRRVVATVITPMDVPGEWVGFENHLNYFHFKGQGIDPVLAQGLAAFLNSTLVDQYFRQFNGHTQVNATDLRNLRYPDRLQLQKLGERVGTTILSQEELDTIVTQELSKMSNLNTTDDPIRVKRRIDEAFAILRRLGFPRAQQNERSALTLLALLNLTPDLSWAQASNPLCGITPMMDFFAQYYGKQYKPNTRETVRRQTVHQFLDAAIITINPDDPDRPVNSPKAVYQIDGSVLELLRTFGTDQWEANLSVYMASIETLKQRYAQEREMQRIPVTLPSGTHLKLSPGGQNVLIKQIIDEFAGRFTPGGEILYVGDTDEKFAFFAEDRMQELGVAINTHGKMPDVVIYFNEKQWLVLIEAVTSHGPINPKRRGELAFLFRGTKVGIIYVTSFLTRQAMKEYLPDISWSTEVWVADTPDHLIHFNGDRFLGPYDPHR